MARWPGTDRCGAWCGRRCATWGSPRSGRPVCCGAGPRCCGRLPVRCGCCGCCAGLTSRRCRRRWTTSSSARPSGSVRCSWRARPCAYMPGGSRIGRGLGCSPSPSPAPRSRFRTGTRWPACRWPMPASGRHCGRHRCGCRVTGSFRCTGSASPRISPTGSTSTPRRCSSCWPSMACTGWVRCRGSPRP